MRTLLFDNPEHSRKVSLQVETCDQEYRVQSATTVRVDKWQKTDYL